MPQRRKGKTIGQQYTTHYFLSEPLFFMGF